MIKSRLIVRMNVVLLLSGLAACAHMDGAPAPAQDSARAQAVPGPIRLLRPLAPESVQVLQADAEGLFRRHEDAQARIAFEQLLELDPDNVVAWLRLGNLLQRSANPLEAETSYRRVLELTAKRPDDEPRSKALLNLALLGIWRSQQALSELERLPESSLMRSEHQRIVTEGRRLGRRVAMSEDALRRAQDKSRCDASPASAKDARGSGTRRRPGVVQIRRTASGARAQPQDQGAGSRAAANESSREVARISRGVPAAERANAEVNRDAFADHQARAGTNE